ncbi:Diaminopimelate epimerase-like protein [Aulographum hederae CBS 113979]|uniref:Diaminopimelate epimerase-like protein n=1 Tax=Aulographum hederae CBS 113979 TaxID=1176131 RepID=A0A6G1GS61_9PEZI|nr:Diaminopimelate epimerase-like protein [Aulographum hederae CBS 113979]
MPLPFTTLDVFTTTKYLGNPLAIVHLPTSSSSTLTQPQKQSIAREFNLSETVFLHPQSPAQKESRIWQIDIFTTFQEVPFAGHPTIGAACYVLGRLADNGKCGNGVVEGTILTQAGSIPISLPPSSSSSSSSSSDSKKIEAKAQIPHNFHVHSSPFPRSSSQSLFPALASPSHESALRKSAPIVSIVKGMTFILVEVATVEALEALSATVAEPGIGLDEGWAPSLVGMYFYHRVASAGTGEGVETAAATATPKAEVMELRTRMFCEGFEDPATGSAACTLACYLATTEGKNLKVRIVQGEEMGRRSEIGVEVGLGEGREVERVELSGSAVEVMEGRLLQIG